jgi:predicted GNAT family acetyltransferase
MLNYLEEIKKIVGGTEISIFHSAKSRCYQVIRDNEKIAEFYLARLDGCCGVCVSYHTNVDSRYRKKGLGLLLNKIKQQIAYKYRYAILLCTDVETNTPQQKILTKTNWQKMFEFVNKKTANTVGLHMLTLKDLDIDLGMQDLCPYEP